VVVNKSELIQNVAGAADVGKQDAEKVIDAFFDAVRTAVGAGDRVSWPNFGSFSVTARNARTGRNPQTGEPVAIAASRAVKFSASTALKAAMNPAPAKGAKKTAKTAAKTGSAPKASTKKTAAAKAPTKKTTKKSK